MDFAAEVSTTDNDAFLGKTDKSPVQDLKTEETFNHLEKKLDESISKTSQFLYKLWNEDQHIQLFADRAEDSGEDRDKQGKRQDEDDFVARGEKAAQEMLDVFDSKLKIVDNFIHNKEKQKEVTENATKVLQNTWSGWSSGLSSLGDNLKSKINEVSNSIGVPADSLFASTDFSMDRTTYELNQLAIDENIYLDYNGNTGGFQDIGEDEIAKELIKNTNLKKLCDSLVSRGMITNKEFWNIYFTKKNDILESKVKREQLASTLNKKTQSVPSWDDEDEEDEEEQDSAVSDSSDKSEQDHANNIRLESREDMVIVNTGNKHEEDNEEDEEDDEDDWN